MCALPAVAVAILLLAGPFVFAEQGPAVVRLWDFHVHDKKFRQNIFKQFNKANPDIKVEYTSQVGDSYQMVLDASFRADDPPDIFVPTNTASVPKLVEMGWVMPLDQVAPSPEELRKWMARFPQEQQPFLENGNMFGGKVYSWPAGAEGGRMMLFWNTKLFSEAGLKGSGGGALVPESWDDMRLAAKKVTEVGQGKVYGIVHGIKSPQIWDQDIFWGLAISAGWPMFGFDYRTARYDFHHPGLRGSVQLWLDMKKDGSVFPGDLSMDDEQAKFRFAQDVAGMIFGGWWVPGGLLAITDSLEFDTVLPPTPKAGDRKGYLRVGPLAFTSEYVVSSRTRNREAVWRVIQFMTSQEYQEGWVQAGGGFSVFPEFNKPDFFPHPTTAKIAAMATTGRRTDPYFIMSKDALKAWGYVPVEKPVEVDIMQGMWIGQLGWDAWDDYERRSNIAFDKSLEAAQKDGLKVTRADFTFADWDPAENYPRSGSSPR